MIVRLDATAAVVAECCHWVVVIGTARRTAWQSQPFELLCIQLYHEQTDQVQLDFAWLSSEPVLYYATMRDACASVMLQKY